MPDKPRYSLNTVRVLMDTDLVTPPTRSALEARLAASNEAEAAALRPRFFNEADFSTLQAACKRLLPTVDGCPAPESFAFIIDARLADGKGNGWRYDALPRTATPTATVCVRCARALPLRRALTKNCSPICARRITAHPTVQASIGYVGMADARGWQRVGLNQLEVWEPEPYAALPPLPPASQIAPAANPAPKNTEPEAAKSSGTLAGGTLVVDVVVDVVVVGTGAGGAPLTARLAQAGLSVVALEAGTWWNPQQDFATDEVAQAKLFWTDERLSAGGDPVAFGNNNSGIGVGGSTLHYTAYTPRPQPDDFRLRSEFGVGCNWPIGYDDLEPYLDEVESFLGISGPTPYPWGPPRRAGYPLPPLPLNGAAQLMQRGCEKLGVRTSPAANAALSAPYFQPGVGWRKACTNRGFCQAGCSVGAKASMDVTFLPVAVAAGAEIRSECFVTQVERDGLGRVSGVVYTQNGAEYRQRCRAVFCVPGGLKPRACCCSMAWATTADRLGATSWHTQACKCGGSLTRTCAPTKEFPAG